MYIYTYTYEFTYIYVYIYTHTILGHVPLKTCIKVPQIYLQTRQQMYLQRYLQICLQMYLQMCIKTCLQIHPHIYAAICIFRSHVQVYQICLTILPATWPNIYIYIYIYVITCLSIACELLAEHLACAVVLSKELRKCQPLHHS